MESVKVFLCGGSQCSNKYQSLDYKQGDLPPDWRFCQVCNKYICESCEEDSPGECANLDCVSFACDACGEAKPFPKGEVDADLLCRSCRRQVCADCAPRNSQGMTSSCKVCKPPLKGYAMTPEDVELLKYVMSHEGHTDDEPITEEEDIEHASLEAQGHYL